MKDSQINPQEHSEIKVKLLKLYLEKYISILSLAKGINEVDVYDLFCGEGLYENGKEGSPVIILKLIKEIFYRNKINNNTSVKFNCHFNDIELNKIEKLSEYIKNKKIHYNEIGTLEFYNFDYQTLKNSILQNRKISKKKSFIFIDPYGYKEISINDIKGLLSDYNTEVLLFIPTQFLYRFKNDAKCVYDFLHEILTDIEIGQSSSGIDFIHKLRGGFEKKLEKKHYVDSFIISRNINQYFALFFFTSHLYGFEKFLEAKWQIDEEEGRGWNSTFNKPNLFSLNSNRPNTDQFQEKLLCFLEDYRTNIEIHKFTIENRHLTKHTSFILKEFQKENKLEVILIDGTPARKGSFYIGWNEVKTKKIKCKIKLK